MSHEFFQHTLGCNAPWVHPTGILLAVGGWAVLKNLTRRIASEKSMLWDQRDNINSQQEVQNSINRIADGELYLLSPIVILITLVSLSLFNNDIYSSIRSVGEEFHFYEPWPHVIIIAMFLVLSIFVGLIFYLIKNVSRPGSTRRSLLFALLLFVELIILFFILCSAKVISLPANGRGIFGWSVAICAVIGIGIYVSRAYRTHAKALASGLLALSVVIDMLMYATVLYGLGSYIWAVSVS